MSLLLMADAKRDESFLCHSVSCSVYLCFRSCRRLGRLTFHVLAFLGLLALPDNPRASAYSRRAVGGAAGNRSGAVGRLKLAIIFLRQIILKLDEQ